MEPGPEADSAGGEAPPAAAAAAAAAGAAPQEDEPSVGRAGGSGDGDGDGGDEEGEALLARAQKLVSKILAARANPNPRHLHALASMLEAQESRYLKEFGSSSSSNGRASHIIGRLGNLIQDNDEFFDLVQSKFLSESRYSVSIRAAAIRLILSCSSSWMYPPVFEDAVLDNIKSWVVDDIAVISGDASNWKDLGRNKPTDSEMLKAYSTGLLAISLSGGGQLVEDVLTSGLSAKLMRYLRIRVLGEANTGQKDAPFPSENRHASGASARGRDERGRRLRPVLEATRSEASRMGDEGLFGDQSTERDHDRNIVVRLPEGEECWADGPESLRTDLGDSPPEVAGVYHIVEENVEQLDERWCGQDMFDGRSRSIERYGPSRSTRDEDADENVRDDLRRRMNRGMLRNRGKGKINEVTLESDMALMSPGGGSKVGRTRGVRDRSFPKCGDAKTSSDTKNMMSRGDSDAFRDDVDDRFKECTIGSRDISDLVKKATMAAEAEATVANAPPEAIRAAGDAAAELVKTSALEAWRSSNDEEAAVLAASKAASTVVDAAIATEMSRQVQVSSDASEDPQSCETVELEKDEDSEEFYILDVESLAQLRENYTVQCLEILGEYVEALGPVLHEKGVDVCLALLQRCFKSKDSPQSLVLLPEILKLICALAAHRKFAAVFVDRGGMQKLLSVERVTQTLFGLSSCLFTIGTLQGIMERVCALPLDVVNELVELALQLLECPQDQARKNAAVFFAAAFVFRAVLDSFDAQEGLQKMLKLLHGTALVRSGGNSGALNLPSAPLRNDRSPADVLTASEKQISYHTCVALRQYFRAHLLLLVDSVRPNKGSRSLARHNSSARAAYKPLDISNEAMDAIFLQIQRDRKLGPAFVRARWPAVDNFLASNGHVIMLELCQAPPAERYLHDLASYALGVLHIVTLVPYSRKMIVNATLSNDRVGMAVILDAINSAGGVDPEVIQPALNVLVNLVCPPPSISNKPPLPAQGQQSIIHALSGPAAENRERNYERTVSDRTTPLPIQSESRERNGEANPVERGSTGALGTPFSASSSQTVVPSIPSGVVGDRRISLGPGAGCAGLAAQLEQGYRQARESVRANNGIKVLLHLLHPRMITPPATLDCLRALACRVLLGLARDETIAHILTKLQVGKKLSELIRDSGSQTSGTEQGRWQTELAQVAIELIAIVTNSGRACTLAATDAAAPTLRRIERAAIAAATPITYHSRELLLLIHEHLQASGLTATAALLQKEAQLTPLPSLSPPQPLHQASVQDAPPVHLQWPSGRAFHGFLSELSKLTSREDDTSLKHDLSLTCSKKKPLHFSSSISQAKVQPSPHPSSITKVPFALKIPFIHVMGPETPISPVPRSDIDPELQYRTPILLPMKRKLMESKDSGFGSPTKRIAGTDFVFQSAVCQTPNSARRSSAPSDAFGSTMSSMPTPRGPFGRSDLLDGADDILCGTSKAGLGTPMAQHALADSQVGGNTERVTLDSLVVQYLKHQHRQCPAPITTLPPLSLLQPHVCPEPSRNLDAPANVTARVSTREFRKEYGGIHAHRRDRQFVYSRFRPWRTCRDEAALLTCVTFLGDSSRIATGSHSGELKIFASESGNVLESQSYHQSPVTLVQSAFSGDNLLVLSSGVYDVRLWDSSSISGGPFHSFDGCKAARFSHTGTMFAALSTETARREVLLYDVQTCSLNLKLSDNLSGSSGQVRGHAQSLIHFSPLDTMLLWNGVLWDRRVSGPVHRFDQFTDYGGGGFHPSGNEVIINSEVWDLRKFRLLRSVLSLDQTVITFNAGGDVIYAILRRNLEDLASAVHSRRVRHPLFPAFRTIDAINYSDIATVPVDRCVLDLATEPTDSIIAVVAMDDHEEMFSSARLYEIGRRRPTDDDSDPDDVVDSDEEDEDEDSEADMESSLGADLDGDGGSDANDLSNDEQDELDSGDELDDDADFNIDDVDFDGGQGILEIVTEGEDEDSEVLESLSSGEEADFAGNGFGF